MRVVRLNLGFTVVYNLTGFSLAATRLLPPVFAAAAQSGPDLGILANSARLLRYGREGHATGTGDGSTMQRNHKEEIVTIAGEAPAPAA
jgi:Cd2+/Zn2+-exporting ATPase/Cu+-exporting ATPase